MPDHLSVTQITTYLMCPRKYRFRYIEGREPEVRSAAMALGSAVHTAIEWWLKARIAGESPPTEAVERVFRADWTAQTAGEDLDFEDKTPEDLAALGLALIRLFVDRFAEEPVTDAELRFEVPLRDPETGEPLPVPLVGYIDFAQDGMIGEIKTTSRRSGIDTWFLQLAAYTYATMETLGHKPRVRVVELVKTKVPKIEVAEVTLPDTELAWFVEVAVEVYRSIQAHAFHPAPSWACERCEFRRACRRT